MICMLQEMIQALTLIQRRNSMVPPPFVISPLEDLRAVEIDEDEEDE